MQIVSVQSQPSSRQTPRSPTPLCCRVTWSFPRTRHDLWLRFGGWRCVCGALLFQASGAACAAVLRIQEEFIQRGCSSGNKLTWLHHRRETKSTRIPLEIKEKKQQPYYLVEWILKKVRVSWKHRGGIYSCLILFLLWHTWAKLNVSK